MSNPRRSVLITAVLSVFVACGDRSPTASTPAVPVPPTMTGLTITAPSVSALVVGTSVQLTAFARYSDGSIQAAQPQWFGGPPGAFGITPSGLLTVLAPGNPVIGARFNGFDASINLFVVADYSGTWRGGWRRLECFGPQCQHGDLANPVVDLLLTQNGTELSAVMLFGPWDAGRFVLSGRGLASIAQTATVGVFWIERGLSGERLREISIQTNNFTVSAIPTLTIRASLTMTDRGEVTRAEFLLENLSLISRAVGVTPRRR